jgi:hypothetical protein
VTLPLPLHLHQGLRPALVLKCPAVGLFDTDTVTVSQPKSALALGGLIRGSFAQGRKQAGHEAPHPRGDGRKPSSPRCSLCGGRHSRKISCLENWRRDLAKGK